MVGVVWVVVIGVVVVVGGDCVVGSVVVVGVVVGGWFGHGGRW